MIKYVVTLKFDHREYYFDFFRDYQQAITFITHAAERFKSHDNIELTATITAEKEEGG